MNTRFALLNYCVRHRLDLPTANGLWRLAAFDVAPPRLLAFVHIGLTSVSALLLGISLVCWIAANWSDLGRPLQFGLLEGAVLLSCIGAAVVPRVRPAFTMFAFLAIGALFAYLGQTYQTGADPWQLFALWAALGVPLVIAARSEIVRVAWVVVLMTGISLWTNDLRQFHVGYPVPFEAFMGAGVALLIAVLLGRRLQRFHGGGPYTAGVAVVYALALISVTVLPDILHHNIDIANTVLLFLIFVAAVFFVMPSAYDIVAICSCALALNFLLDTAVVSWILHTPGHDTLAGIFIIGLIACLLCGISIAAILHAMRRQLDRKGTQ